MEDITPETVKELTEKAFNKNSKKFRTQCEVIPEKIKKHLKKMVKKGNKDPYVMYIGCLTKSLDNKDAIRILRETLEPIEKKWYLSLKILDKYEKDEDFRTISWYNQIDCIVKLMLSEKPISSGDYYTKKSDNICDCKDECGKRCSICDINHIRCVVFPCGHANYCWECVEKIESCGICRAKIFESRYIIV